jgi:Zn-dependent peptidase ImmA (M78 family)/DNA-binding XRE family transcriptional regulator
LSQAALAREIGVSRTAIHYYESGDNTPSEETFDTICTELEFPPEFFLADDASWQTDRTIFWRSLSSGTKKARDRNERLSGWLEYVAHFLESYVELSPVNIPKYEADYASIDFEEIEEIAGRVRSAWNLGSGPISNVVWLLENNGVTVSRLSLGDERLDGYSFWSDDGTRPFVVLNSDKATAVRSRFDAAHELAHLVLHHDVPARLANKPEVRKRLENQAHRFAAAFLFPRSSYFKDVPTPRLRRFQRLKSKWRVSIGMMAYRAMDLDLIDKEEHRQLRIRMSRRGWTRKEPLDDQLTPEQPAVLEHAIKLLISERIISRDELLRRCPFGARNLEDIAGLPRGYLTDDSWGSVHRIGLKPVNSRGEPGESSGTSNSGAADVLDFPGDPNG